MPHVEIAHVPGEVIDATELPATEFELFRATGVLTEQGLQITIGEKLPPGAAPAPAPES